MAIRKAHNGDIKRLTELLSQVLEVHHKGRPDIFKGGAVKYTKKELEELLSDGFRPVFVACDENDVALGYCFCVIETVQGNNILNDMKTLYIDDLCVDEKVRGRHIGTDLYKYALDFAEDMGCYNVTLNVWALNDGALEFYKKLGMEPMKIYMEKRLSL